MRCTLGLGLLLIGCGGGGGSDKTLDCAYLAGDNCWKMTATEATSCLPPAGAMGTLAADNASCTYTTGQTVTFTPALVLPLDSGFKTWNFTVTTNGQDCLHYEETSAGFDLTVSADTVSESIAGASGIDLTCPDGTTYASSNALALLNCPGSSFGDLPGNTTSSSATSVSFGLINTGAAQTITVFDCSR
jgi:hypothetical protein